MMGKKLKRHPGEMGVAASSNGRRLTLDPIKVYNLTVPLNEVESSIPCGFRQGWVSGSHGKEKFDLASGAGCGNRWLTFSYKGKDYTIDATKLVELMIEAIDAK